MSPGLKVVLGQDDSSCILYSIIFGYSAFAAPDVSPLNCRTRRRMATYFSSAAAQVRTHDSLARVVDHCAVPHPFLISRLISASSSARERMGSDRITYWPDRAAVLLRSDFSTCSCSLPGVPAPPPCVIIIPLSRLQSGDKKR